MMAKNESLSRFSTGSLKRILQTNRITKKNLFWTESARHISVVRTIEFQEAKTTYLPIEMNYIIYFLNNTLIIPGNKV